MAYRDIEQHFATPAMAQVMAAPSGDLTEPTRGFSSLEWSVVAIARNDTLASLSEPSRLSRAFGSVFGLGVKSKLADPRLEALRRLAVHAWRRGFALPQSEVTAFIAAGFTLAQAETLVASVTGDRLA